MSEREVPIQKNEMSILDNEFASIREKFEAEMNKMEQEMARFRSMVLDHEKNIFNKAIEPGTVSSHTHVNISARAEHSEAGSAERFIVSPSRGGSLVPARRYARHKSGF